jgi:hypothetical protein
LTALLRWCVGDVALVHAGIAALHLGIAALAQRERAYDGVHVTFLTAGYSSIQLAARQTATQTT